MDDQTLKEDQKEFVCRPPPGFPALISKSTAGKGGTTQMPAPVYVATSAPITGENKTESNLYAKNRPNCYASKVLLKSANPVQPVSLLRSKNVVTSSNGIVSEKAASASAHPFNGSEKPFVPRATLVPTVTENRSKDGVGNLSQGNKISRRDRESIQTPGEDGKSPATTQQRRRYTSSILRGVDLSLTKLKPITSTPSNEFKVQPSSTKTVPVLCPVSPSSQMRMELLAGMKPSNMVCGQGTAENNLHGDRRPMRPILGRKMNVAPSTEKTPTESYQQFCAGIHRKIPLAHSNHKLATLAAEDSAIIFADKILSGDMQPIDLSRNTPSDYARLWSQMTQKTRDTDSTMTTVVQAGGKGTRTSDVNYDMSNEVLQGSRHTGSSLEAVAQDNGDKTKNAGTDCDVATEVTQISKCPFTGKEKPFFPRSMWKGNQHDGHKGSPVLSNTKTVENCGKEDRNLAESADTSGKFPWSAQAISDSKRTCDTTKKACAVLDKTVTETPKSDKKTEATENETCPTEERNDDKLVIVASNSSASTLPYGEDSYEPLNLSCTTPKNSGWNSEESPDSQTRLLVQNDESTPLLDVKGHAIPSRSEECARALIPLETSDGLMDSVYEEDMIKGDSKLDEMRSPSGSELNESFRLYGNNIWQNPNEIGSDSAARSDDDFVVSDSEEEGYMTCNTSLCYDPTATSPVIDFQGRNDSGQGYSMYSARSTPTKVMKYLKHSAPGLKKDLISDIVSAVAGESIVEDRVDETKYKRIVLKGIQHMMATSTKLENILKFESQNEHLSEIQNNQVTSVVKSYLDQTIKCINKIGSIMQKKPKKKVSSSTKPCRGKSSTNESKRSQQRKTKKAVKRRDKFRSPDNGISVTDSDQISENTKSMITPGETTENPGGNASTTKGTPTNDGYMDIPSLGAVDLVTRTPIDGNRYWKKRMLRQNASSSGSRTPGSLQNSGRKNTEGKVPECKKGLLSASFSDDDDDDDQEKARDVKLTWTPCSKLQSILKLGSDKKRHEKTDKSFTYRKLKDYGQKGSKGKAGQGAKKNVKRKRSKGSPTTVSPTSIQIAKKSKSTTAQLTSSHRRHFPYQNQCNKVIDCVYNLPESYPFREEFRNDEEPNYYKVIKYPMFFELVTSKLRQRLYYRLEDFVSDVRRVFWNTRYFYEKFMGQTTESCPTLRKCDYVEAFFEIKLRSTFPFMDFSAITGSPQASKTKVSESKSEHQDLDVFEGEKVKGALRELWK